MATPEKIKLRVLELRAEGLSFAKIAEETKVAKQTAVDIVKENIDEVSTLRAIEMEALFDTQRVNQRGRIEQLSALHTRLREEIASRDLTDVPTDKLITLYIKTSEALKGEVFTPTIQSTEEQQQAARDRARWDF
jgi:orotate phosphoribosyltransferase-like protein